jgi:sulfur carrier protein
MELIVNGSPQTVERACSVRRLLEILDKTAAPCAVEVNRELIPRANHDETLLKEGDQIEIVTLVGGG